MKSYFPPLRSKLVVVLLIVAMPAHLIVAQEPSIDRLLSKLPPPEKLVKPPVQQALRQADPATKDPLVRQILQEEMARNLPRALNLSRKLTERYPRSAGAQSLRGMLAWSTRQFGEASSAFRTAITIEPKLAFGHFGLALVEGGQGHFAAAIPHLRRVAELEPKAPLPYYALSDCALGDVPILVGNGRVLIGC
jgi:tetratricopeptide (TPR) repeat protein